MDASEYTLFPREVGPSDVKTKRLCMTCGGAPISSRGECQRCYKKTRFANRSPLDVHRQRLACRGAGLALTRGQKEAIAQQPCRLCGKTNAPRSIDHDHATGVIRGPLCQFCNVVISPFDRYGVEVWAQMVREYLNVPYQIPAVSPERERELRPGVRRGSTSQTAKLTERDVQAIRWLLRVAAWSMAKVGRHYQVGTPTIWKIFHETRWGHVQGMCKPDWWVDEQQSFLE